MSQPLHCLLPPPPPFEPQFVGNNWFLETRQLMWPPNLYDDMRRLRGRPLKPVGRPSLLASTISMHACLGALCPR
jgi:hypothetical protein